MNNIVFIIKQKLAVSKYDDLLKFIVNEMEDVTLQEFIKSSPANATYTSPQSLSGFIDAIYEWVFKIDMNYLKSRKAWSIMLDETEDGSSREELLMLARTIDDHGNIQVTMMDMLKVKNRKAAGLYQLIGVITTIWT